MTTTVSCPGIALKLRKLAEAQTAKVEYLRRPMTQNSTPKRQREYVSRCIDGDNLERGRLAMLALADAWERGDVPEILKGLKTKDAIVALVRHAIVSNGYYHVASSHEYADQSDAGKALQSLLAESMGEVSREQLEAVKKQRELEGMIDRLRFADIPGFFPTPLPVVNLMLAHADLRDGQTILEPSAGIGTICDAVKAQGFDPLVCEINYSMRDILAAKGYKFYGTDFLQCLPIGGRDQGPDRILMNPPFERGQDIDHILHAHKVLKPGGRMVSIVSAGPLFRQDAKSVAFREWLENVGAKLIRLPEKSFVGTDVFRQTGASCTMLVIDKERE